MSILPAQPLPPGTLHGATRILLLLTAMAVLMVGLTPPPAGAAATITLSGSAGTAGAGVTVTGAGFPKRTKGTVVAGTSRVAVTTTSTGTLQVSIVPGGSGTVTISAAVGSTAASAGYTVLAAAPGTDSAKGIRFGVGTGGGPAAGSELDEVAALAGEAPSIVLSYKDFNQPAPIAELESVRARGAETLLTWEPWTWGGGTEQPAYSLDRIAAGDFDA